MTVLERYEALLASDKYIDTRDHIPFLRSVAKGNVLEIGTDVGNSTTALLLGVKENGGHLTSVDIKDCFHLFDDQQWTFYCLDSTKQDVFFMQERPAARHFDVVYIDGSHEYDDVKKDISLAVQFHPSLILMHDVLAQQFPGVRQAFDEITLPKHIREGSWGLGVIQA